MESIKKWISANNLNVSWINDNSFTLDNKKYVCIKSKDGRLFDSEFNLIIDSDEINDEYDYFCFEFGDKIYYSPFRAELVQLNLLKYVGKADGLLGFPYLGIHGGYELCSGSRKYEDWCKKANFLSIDTLAISERNTLAGALKFQIACKKENIKSIIGETIVIKNSKGEFKVKLYVSNVTGWRNLLRIHKRLNIDNSRYVEEEFLLEYSEGLYCVFQNDTMLSNIDIKLWNDGKFNKAYFQIDPVEYKASKRDIECLECLKYYLNNFRHIFPPILIIDSYYLDQEDSDIVKALSFIGKSTINFNSSDQYLKTLDQVAVNMLDLFASKGEDFAMKLLEEAMDCTYSLCDGCDFKIPTGKIFMPKYAMTSEESKLYKDNEDLFWSIINTALDKLIQKRGKSINQEEYLARIEAEYQVISKGNFQDYFLILRDIINWCEKNDILVGTARGSAAGSLIAYLMNVVRVDPMEYDLIFERFLNESRIGKGLPDIDTDFQSKRREDVKRYMEQRFGINNVCSIGTYTTLQSKGAFRDLLRFEGEEPQKINYMSGMIEDSNEDFAAIFIEAAKNQRLKAFIDEHSNTIQTIPLILGQPKSASIHAAGVICTPTEFEGEKMQVYDWFPCKKVDGILISEWEGVQLDDCGFLKADILGLSQLDKLSDMLQLIKENHGVELKLNEIDTKDAEVFNTVFKTGFTQDIFQFTTDGLSAYCREVKPESVEELAAMNALYRPGPMNSGAHTDFVKIKFGKKKPEYDYGTEEILKGTYGLMIYQEQAIRIVQKIGGLSLSEGDGVRKATGKKDIEKMKSYKDQFVSGAIKNGCPELEAQKIWNKIEVFAEYSFNLSHAISYSLIGYQTAWIKYHYPMEFWTVSLHYANDDETPLRISELRKTGKINLLPPDINNSKKTFVSDFNKKTIYWSLSKIRFAGEVAVNTIIEERDKNGIFFSLEEFYERIPKRSVNKRVVVNMILSGCFDNMCGVKEIFDRRSILKEFFGLIKEEMPDEFNVSDEFFWFYKQREASGSGYFDYYKLASRSLVQQASHRYTTPDKILLSTNVGSDIVIGGILKEITIRQSKKGQFAQLIIDHNNELINTTLWSDVWDTFKDEVEKSIDKAIIFSGKIVYDEKYLKKNVVHSTPYSDIEFF